MGASKETDKVPEETDQVPIIITSNKQKEQKLQKQQTEESLCNLSKLFDKSLLAELTSDDMWMDRLRPVIERGDRQGFELMGPYTNPSVVADGGAGRLHSGEQQTDSTSSTETSCAQTNSSGTSGSRGYARCVTIPVVAAYAQGHSEPRGRVS